MDKKNKTYTAADFARYHSGTMPAGEMQALEKAAMEDPFLEDALEGYVHAAAAESDIEELRARLAEKRKKKNVFLISSIAQNKWWRIAALFIIMGGAGYFFYRITHFNKENTVAKNADNAPIKRDSATTTNDIAFENQPASNLAEKKKAALPVTKPRTEREPNVATPKTEPKIADNYLSPLKDSSYTFSTSGKEAYKETNAVAARGYLLKGKVTDEKGNALPYVSVTDKIHKKVTVTDTAGLFLFRSKDSSITAKASAPGYDSKSFTIKKDSLPTIAMNKENAALDEVVVAGYSNKHKQLKRSSSASKALSGKASGVQITSALPQPSGGREKFDQYLKENIAPIYDDNNERLTGEVLLSFTINKKGRPKNIKVLKSSCEACEEEAIRLLKKGPDWIGGKDTAGRVGIKF